MNFGKRSVEKKQEGDNSARVGKKIALIFFKAVLICVGCVGVLTLCLGYGMIRGLIHSAPDISSLSVSPTEAATYILDGDGNEMQKLSAATSNRTLVSLEQIPVDLQHAVVSVEDERFYKHNGIDLQGIARAFVVGVTSGNFSEGASTITQQLIKNNVFTDWVTETSLSQKFQRKFQEQYLALQLEKKLSKEDILEDYLNTINLGAGAYGVQAAAHTYFNKDVSELTLSEATVIAGITQNPTAYNPIIYPENNAKRREWVLDHMLDQEYITKEQYDQAKADDVYSRIKENEEMEEVSIYSYYVDAMIDQILDDLQEQKGYTYQQAYKMLYTGGLRVHSVQNQNIQKICDEEFANPLNFPSGTEVGLDYALSVESEDGETTHYGREDFLKYYQTIDPAFNMMFPDNDTANAGVAGFRESVVKEGDTILGERISLMPQPQASVVIIDQSTGFVQAIVGGRGTKEASLTLNRATYTRRQPGSTFKILTTYAPALDAYDMTLGTVFDNAPYAYSNGVEVRNWDSDYGYSGLTTIRQAITDSVNVVAVKCLTELTPQIGIRYAERFGISTLHNDATMDATQALALGGIYEGVVNLELTGGFAAIANKGQYIEPKFYSKIEDSEGNVLIDNTPVSTTVIKETTASLLTSAMEDVVTQGTGTAINLGDMPVAGKTGTTSDYKDIWFAGYTPYYTCTVWGGYDNNDDLPDTDTYHNYNKTLWNSIMQRVHADLPRKDFEMSSNLTQVEICKKSGKQAISGVCQRDPRGSQVVREYFVPGTEPTGSCDAHLSLSICNETGLRAVSSCKATNRVYLVRPTGSEGTTDDSNYAPPAQTCKGHTVVDSIIKKFKDILGGDDEDNEEIVTETEDIPEGEQPDVPEGEQPQEPDIVIP